MERRRAAVAVGLVVLASVVWLVASAPGGTRAILCAEPADAGSASGPALANGSVLAASTGPVADESTVRSLVAAAAASGDAECERFSRSDFAALRQRLGDEAHVAPEDRAPRGYYVRYNGAVYRVYSSVLA